MQTQLAAVRRLPVRVEIHDGGKDARHLMSRPVMIHVHGIAGTTRRIRRHHGLVAHQAGAPTPRRSQHDNARRESSTGSGIVATSGALARAVTFRSTESRNFS
jgi:hypothetical protein